MHRPDAGAGEDTTSAPVSIWQSDLIQATAPPRIKRSGGPVWVDHAIHIRWNVVNGRVGDVKTDCSEATVPLDPANAELLLKWKRVTPFPADSDGVFDSPFSGGKLPYLARGIQQRHIRPAMDNAGLDPQMGWHTFRGLAASLRD